MTLPSQGWLLRIACSVSVENTHSHWIDREGEQGSNSQNGGGRKCLLPLFLNRVKPVRKTVLNDFELTKVTV